jgi:hypothetical protein
MYPDHEIEIYSIGSGELSLEEQSEQLKGKGLLSWIKPAIRHLQIGNSILVNDTLHKLLNQDDKEDYFRINTQLAQEHKNMDDTSDANIAYLLEKAEEAMNGPRFQQMMDRLLMH